jgi:hypothetical protein
VEVIKIELKFVRETLGDIKNHQRTNGKSK